MSLIDAFETRCLDSLAKVFSDEPLQAEPHIRGTALFGEYYSYQIAYRMDRNMKNIRIAVESDLAEWITIRSVGLVPSEFPNYGDHDDYLLRTTPGLYPDPLYPLEGESGRALPNQWKAIWVTVQLKENARPGNHPIIVHFIAESGEKLGSESFELEVIPAVLPEQEIIHTEWFYLDCLATRYNVEVFSEAHWTIIDAYLSNYVAYGMNMILTPLFTPPLEMLFGKERPTVQLVGVKREAERYTFDFSKLERWIELCLGKGVKHFEFSHLFTQWGAKHAPKIMAEINGEECRAFGWETDSAGEAYRHFLAQFLPELVRIINKHDLKDRSYFHLSDEPHINDLPSYRNASTLLRSLLKDYPIIDALSDYDFYATGLLTHPVVSTEHIGKYIEHDTPNLWAYYCCCEYKAHLSNRFFNMPSSRTRIIGAQLYKFDIQGFLHWGYNHWYSQKSLKEIDPYLVTDADHGFPSGDAFLVYPGKAGPIASIRLELMREAMQDVRAFQLLEQLIGKEQVLRCIEDGLDEPMTFQHYDRSRTAAKDIRERVNGMIQEARRKSGSVC